MKVRETDLINISSSITISSMLNPPCDDRIHWNGLVNHYTKLKRFLLVYIRLQEVGENTVEWLQGDNFWNWNEDEGGRRGCWQGRDHGGGFCGGCGCLALKKEIDR